MAKFEIYKDGHGEFRWRLKLADSQSIATSGEAYSTKALLLDAIAAVKREAAAADVDDQTATTF